MSTRSELLLGLPPFSPWLGEGEGGKKVLSSNMKTLSGRPPPN